ncbi:hypothetical protein ACHAXR_012858 [Thalassiosira sp. AJA248-18]
MVRYYIRKNQPPSSRRSMVYSAILVMLAVSSKLVPDGDLRNRFFVSAFSASPTDASASSTKPLTGAASSKTKRIAIVGAGAVGSYYGGRLWEGVRSQEDTHVVFHLRNENYNHCIEHGIDVSSYHGDFSIPAEELSAFPTTEEMAKSVDSAKGDGGNSGGTFDWVVCALKSTSVSELYLFCMRFHYNFNTTGAVCSFLNNNCTNNRQLDEVPKLIEPLLSPETRVLVIMNGLIEDDLKEMMRTQRERKGLEGLGCKAIYGGMALICSNRLSPGKISHTYGGKLVCGVAYSADANDDSGQWVESDKQAILDLFEPVTPVPFEFDPNLRRGRWWKNVWNLPFSGISVSMGGITVDRIVNDESLRKLAYKVIDETIAVANADLIKHGCSEDELLGEETPTKFDLGDMLL